MSSWSGLGINLDLCRSPSLTLQQRLRMTAILTVIVHLPLNLSQLWRPWFKSPCPLSCSPCYLFLLLFNRQVPINVLVRNFYIFPAYQYNVPKFLRHAYRYDRTQIKFVLFHPVIWSHLIRLAVLSRITLNHTITCQYHKTGVQLTTMWGVTSLQNNGCLVGTALGISRLYQFLMHYASYEKCIK